ncbi:MAG: 2-oxoglutarate synthase [Candidatus Latescibacteria bacterium]|nr:2-oxoglutarate synthase [Candidatus Latescibacterota bacterium]
MTVTHPYEKYIRPSAIRTTNCPGCGNGILAQSILRAIDEEKLDMDDFVFVSGIGCAAWIPSPFFHADVLHTTHGRPIAFATGVKLAAPDRRVMVVSGDGDLLAIGGNHFIHAARRNLNMTVICVNNSIYGMTGGQVAPTTPMGLKTMTSPYGNVENSFDISELAAAAGATYVARWTVFQALQITRTVKKALNHKGFSLIEIISQCPVQFGRKSGMGNTTQMFDYYKENSVSIKKASGMSEDDLTGKIVVGELVEKEKPTLDEEMEHLRQSLRERGDHAEN